MRCDLDYDPEKMFSEQKVEAWGVMQSLTEEPCYREEDIKDPLNLLYFRGYKAAVDESIVALSEILFDDIGSIEEFKEWCAANICMLLFSILDEQSENEVCES